MKRLGLWAVALGIALVPSFPVLAQDVVDAEAESLIAASSATDSGLSLARRQIDANDLIGAAGTLERVLLTHPDFLPARLLYASLLCQLDDRTGAEVELSFLGGYTIGDEEWAEISRSCGSFQRPGAETSLLPPRALPATQTAGGAL